MMWDVSIVHGMSIVTRYITSMGKHSLPPSLKLVKLQAIQTAQANQSMQTLLEFQCYLLLHSLTTNI